MKNIGDLIGKGTDRVAHEDTVLRRQVSQCVPDGLMRNVLFVREEDQRLRVTLSSAAWASRMRFFSEDILRFLATSGIILKEVSVHVQPQQNLQHLQRKCDRKPAPVTQASASHVGQVADGIDDPKLRAALLNLAAVMDAKAND